MPCLWRRVAARPRVRATILRSLVTTFVFACVLGASAHAVIVRGRLTDPLGSPVPGGQVRLVEAGKVVAMAFAGPDGTFEIRSADAGRFTLLGSGGGFLPFVGSEFYGGATDVVDTNVVLSGRTIRQDVSVTATGIPTPLPQLTAPVTLVSAGDLATRVGVVDELRQAPGVFLVQQGQAGAVGSLFVRGGPSDGNKVVLDGVPANDMGGVFDFGAVSSTALEQVELYRGPDSVIYGSDAEASVVSFTTPRGSGLIPTLNYSGDAGTLHTWRNEATVGGAWRKLDYYAAGSRFDTSNALPNDRFHAVTAAANVGYEVLPQTYLRGTLRDERNAEGLPGAYDFLGLTVNGKQADNDLFAQGRLERTEKDAWHNLLRYGIARKYEQTSYFGQAGTPVTLFPSTPFAYTEYFGNVVTIRGANGYTATGQADIFNAADALRSNRDELYFQSDRPFGSHVSGLFGFRYENERGSLTVPSYGENEAVQRTNFEYTLQAQGDVLHRLFFSAGGAVEKNHLYGLAFTPRLGLAYVPVRPRAGWMHGTKLRATFAKGVHEPSLEDEFSSLYRQLANAGQTAAIAAYGVGPLNATRSRTYDIGIEQNLKSDRLVVKLGYFHNQFDHQLDFIDANTLATDFGIRTGLSGIYGAELNSLAYRAQGVEAEIEGKAGKFWFFRGGYTYLDAVVEQSFSTDAAYNGTSTTNPNLPNVPIGSSYPLVGARPFRRPPHTGFVAASYTRPKVSVRLKGALASRSDDSTFLSYADINGDNTLLLPNRNLDFGYMKLDIAATYQWRPQLAFFTQIDNVLNDQHIGPIGYPGLPLTLRAGVKVRLGGE